MQINIEGIENDINLEEAQRAFHNVSFRSESRGQRVVEEYVIDLKQLAQHIEKHATDERQQAIAQQVFEDLRQKYKARTLSWLAAKSRCISSMITGPANFPVRRAEKANNSEHNRMTELIDFANAMFGYAVKNLDKAIPKEEKKVDEIKDLKEQIAKAKKNQGFMKQANALNRKKDEEGLDRLFLEYYGEVNYSAILANFKKPNYMNATGYERFELTNNLARIKRMEERLVMLEKKAVKAETIGEEAQSFNGLEIVRNHAEDRLQLIFEGKPCETVRGLLKSHGFRWSPRFNAWQRQLTNNAEYSLKNFVMKNEAMQQYQAAEV